MYHITDLIRLKEFYFNQLMNSTIPFWFPHSIDQEHGGYLLMRDADGSLIDSDKSVWFLGRTAWMMSTLCNTFGLKQEWLVAAESGIKFMEKYAFDSDGRMFFHLTREGLPIRKRRYFFSEIFAVIAFAAYSKASGNIQYAHKSKDLLDKCIEYYYHPELLDNKYTTTRPSKGYGVRIIMINTIQEYRSNTNDESYNHIIDELIDEISRDFIKHDLRCVMEQVAPDGAIIDHIDGRTLNPGHAIEGAWFIMEEARYRGVVENKHLIDLGTKMLDYMWERGWDKEYGGMFYFRDVYHKPVQEYWQDMKFWWPQNETIIATLLAFILTGDSKYAEWHKMVHDYAYAHFFDSKHGEWFGYLHRDGSIAQTAKGNLYKGPFHLPRQEWFCHKIINV